ncbi:ATP-dependent helicase [Oceaniserpentilla sp. 4NH20-0058]|uniref:ATP-dependent helicase n=1 Tax=Oceaniserpentilla sp. 4NH20-0058 TaxID=3127660 RepID=UPI00333F665C
MQLTDQQLSIISHNEGHGKVIAVAGAGKTSTLALFIKARLDHGQNSKRLLVIMYNKSAQVDFSEKLRRVMTGPLPQVRTFHSLGLKIYQGLVQQGWLAGFQEQLISQSEQEYILWRLLQQHAPNKNLVQEILNDKKKWLDPMMSFMEQVKSALNPAKAVFNQSGLPKQCQFFVKVFAEFELWRKQQQRITYSDMLYDPCMLFSERPDLAAHYANHMDWILVDEYQDINPIQQFLLETLSGQRAKVLVIGDPDQTIYEFRGSSSHFMLSYFDEHFKGAITYELSRTFRYGHDVALLSNQLIHLNKQRQPVMAIAHESNPDTQVQLHTDDDYARRTLQIIKQGLTQYPPEHIAVLLRLWGMSAPLELALLQENIPYQMAHHSWVLERYELQPFIMLFEVAAKVFHLHGQRKRFNSWLMFLTFPALKIKRNQLEAIAQQLSLSNEEPVRVFKEMDSELSTWQKQQVENRLQLVTLALHPRITAHQLINRYLRETDFYKGLSDSAFSSQQVDDRIATVQGFSRFLAKMNLAANGTHDYLQELTLRKREQTDQKGIVISSIHRAKGLQWPVVILPGLTEHYYPYQSDGEMQQATSVESERRLFYVAMTRSMNQLHLITPTQQAMDSGQNTISPFIQAMNVSELLTLQQAYKQGEGTVRLSKPITKLAKQYAETLAWPLEIKVKASKAPNIKASTARSKTQVPSMEVWVKHHRFGKGLIKYETQSHWQIQFEDGSVKTLDKHIAQPMMQWL